MDQRSPSGLERRKPDRDMTHQVWPKRSVINTSLLCDDSSMGAFKAASLAWPMGPLRNSAAIVFDVMNLRGTDLSAQYCCPAGKKARQFLGSRVITRSELYADEVFRNRHWVPCRRDKPSTGCHASAQERFVIPECQARLLGLTGYTAS